MLNLDPALLDQDKIRKEKRRRLLLHSSLPIFLLLGMSVYFLSTWVYNLVFMISYENKNYPIADGFTETRFISNILEPYIADYNQGVSRLMMGEYVKAENSFTESLKKNPAKDRLCQIYVNLSLSIEYQADAAVQKEDYLKAIELYNRAKGILYSNNCAEEGADSGGKDSKAETAEQRNNDKAKDAADRMNNTGGGDTPGGGDEKKQVSEEDLKSIRNELIFGGYHAGHFASDSTNGADSCRLGLDKQGRQCW